MSEVGSFVLLFVAFVVLFPLSMSFVLSQTERYSRHVSFRFGCTLRAFAEEACLRAFDVVDMLGSRRTLELQGYATAVQREAMIATKHEYSKSAQYSIVKVPPHHCHSRFLRALNVEMYQPRNGIIFSILKCLHGCVLVRGFNLSSPRRGCPMCCFVRTYTQELRRSMSELTEACLEHLPNLLAKFQV